MGLVERWNRFAKKRIFINSDFQIGMGRLVYVGLITLLQAIGMLVIGAGAGIPSLILNALFALEKRSKEEKKD